MLKQKEFIDSTNLDYYLNVIREFLEVHQIKKRIAESPDEKFPIDLRRKAGQELLIGLDAPKELGGEGFSALTMGKIYKEMGKVDVNTRELFGLGHARMLAYDDNINDYKRDVLNKVLKGECLIGIGMTEESSGSDIKNIQTTVRKVANGTYLLNGKKTYVSRILESQYFLVLAKMVDLNDKLTFFLVPTSHPNIKISNINPTGLKGWSYGSIYFENVYLSKDQLVGNEGNGFYMFQKHFAYWRVLMGLLCIGAAEEALGITVNYAKEREVFGKPIASFHSVSHPIVKHYSYLKAAELFCYDALSKIDSNNPSITQSAMAKVLSTEVAYQAIDDCIQFFGARGYTKEYDLEKRLRDVRAVKIADGSNPTLISYCTKDVFGENIYKLTKEGDFNRVDSCVKPYAKQNC